MGAVVSVTEHKPPTFSSTADEDTATRYFIVKLLNINYGPQTAVRAVMDNFGIRVGTWYRYGYEFSSGCRAKTIGPATVVDGNRTLYTLQVEYSTTQPDEEETPDDPLDMATKWGPSGSRTEGKIVTNDKDGKPILNTANDPIAEGIEVEKYIPWVRATKNVDAVDFGNLAKYTGAWNSARFLGQPRDRVLCTELAYSGKQWHGDHPYYEMTGTFEFYDEEQFIELPSQGFNAIFAHGRNDVKARICAGSISPENMGGANTNLENNTGMPVQSPVLLDTDGFVAVTGQQEVDDATAATIKVDLKRSEPLGRLGF